MEGIGVEIRSKTGVILRGVAKRRMMEEMMSGRKWRLRGEYALVRAVYMRTLVLAVSVCDSAGALSWRGHDALLSNAGTTLFPALTKNPQNLKFTMS